MSPLAYGGTRGLWLRAPPPEAAGIRKGEGPPGGKWRLISRSHCGDDGDPTASLPRPLLGGPHPRGDRPGCPLPPITDAVGTAIFVPRRPGGRSPSPGCGQGRLLPEPSRPIPLCVSVSSPLPRGTPVISDWGPPFNLVAPSKALPANTLPF